MEHTNNECREPESLTQYAMDTLLLPFRIATSPALLRTYLRTILLCITSTILFGAAVVAYSSFYYAYIPVRGISVPVYLQFDHGTAVTHQRSITTDLNRERKWPYGIANMDGLVSRQKYDVVVEMTVPRSRRNLDAGNWMIVLEMRAPSAVNKDLQTMLEHEELWTSDIKGPGDISEADVRSQMDPPTVLKRSRRPAILTYRSWAVEHAHRLLRLPLYLAGWGTESEHIQTSMMESVEFDKGAKNIPSSLKLDVRSKHPLEIYTVSVRVSAKLEGLRWLMYKYWLSSAAAGILLFWSVEMGVLLFTWAAFTLLLRSSSGEDEQHRKKIKSEHHDDKSTIKQERNDDSNTEPTTPLSDTSRTFPTLPSQQPLSYTSPSPSTPKHERTTPALEDIPLKEDAEADDEDDDFVLEEPPLRSVEGQGGFTDSGIGTGLESAMERELERGLSRRRSGRGRGRDRDGDKREGGE